MADNRLEKERNPGLRRTGTEEGETDMRTWLRAACLAGFLPIFLTCFSTCFSMTMLEAEDKLALFPPIEPHRAGHLKVSDLHEIYWEVCGSEQGAPVIVLHGGPGARVTPEMRRFFDPAKHRIILFDQRGAGRSRPSGEWRENTTSLLVEDIQKLRRHLGVEGKAILFGGSWGTTLGLAYAQAYPEFVSGMLLRGVFLATKAEVDYFYHGGTAAHFPENFERLRSVVPRPAQLDYPRQLFEMTQSEDAAIRRKAINGWAFYEIRMGSLEMTDEACERRVSSVPEDVLRAFSVLENYYMMNACFLEEGQLFRRADRIAKIPTYIVNGRYDAVCPPRMAYELASRLKDTKLELPVAGHSQSDPANTEALLRGARWLSERVSR
jgi:proline iminopeptidase